MFQPFKQWAEQDTEAYIIANSQTVNVGDAVTFVPTAGSGGFVTGAASQTTVYGIIVGFMASPGGASQQNLVSTQVIAANNNQTSNQYRARVLPARQSRLFLSDLSQTAGTTTGSGDPGFFTMASTNGTLTETSYTVASAIATPTSSAVFFSVGSGLATSSNGPTGLYPAASTQVVGFFRNQNF